MASKENIKNLINYLDLSLDSQEEEQVKQLLDTIANDLERLEKLENVTKLFLTKYVPLDSLSPDFWESKEEWLSTMSYDYYLFLCEEQCEYVVKENRRLNSDEFDLIYKLLKEWLGYDK